MPRYIDAEKLDEHKFKYITYERYVSDGRLKSEKEIYAYKVGYNEPILEIEQFAPTADVVEVVRCKDCKHNSKTATDDVCPFVDGDGYISHFPDDKGFCYKGEM